jgi:hypothetical protein
VHEERFCLNNVTIVEIKDVELPQTMQRAMAKQAQAEREKRAKIIHAAGEFEASKMLAAAADVMAKEPVTLQLRYLQTLTETAVEKNSTIHLPVAGRYDQGLSRSPGNEPHGQWYSAERRVSVGCAGLTPSAPA